MKDGKILLTSAVIALTCLLLLIGSAASQVYLLKTADGVYFSASMAGLQVYYIRLLLIFANLVLGLVTLLSALLVGEHSLKLINRKRTSTQP